MTLCEARPALALCHGALPVLETERLVLRAPHAQDIEALAALANDKRVAENTARIPHPYRLSDAEAFVEGANRADGEATFAVLRDDGTFMGACGLAAGSDQAPELGYWIGAPFGGQGFATEAVRAVIDHAFADVEHAVLQAAARVTNPASRRVLEKCGFQWTGVGLCRIRALGSSAPVDRFRLDRGLWASLKHWGAVRRVA